MVEKMKITEGMIKGVEPVPEGYQLKVIPHTEFTYINKAGKTVRVSAHSEHILVRVKPKEETPKTKAPETKPSKKK